MKGNLAFKLTFQPKVMLFPLLSFTENTSTPLITVSPPDDYSAPLCKLGQEITYYPAFVSWHVSEQLKGRGSCCESLPAPQQAVLTQEQSHPWFWGAPESPGIPVENPESRWQRSLAALPWTCHGHSHWYFPKNPWLCMEIFSLDLNLPCFLSSKIVAFTKTSSVFMWKEHGDVSRS